MDLPFILLTITAVTVLITFLIASYQDLKTRTVYTVTWYPAAIICTICIIWFWILTFSPTTLPTLIISIIIAAIMTIFTLTGLYGKADAKAMILLALAVPVTPFAQNLFPSLAVSSIINAGIIAMIVPAALLCKNLIAKNKAPFWLMISGMPVSGAKITRYFGFIAENISRSEDATINRKFTKVSKSITALRSGRSIRELRENPNEHTEELALYAECENVWITYGIPFMIPITLGYILALFGFSIIDLFITLIL